MAVIATILPILLTTAAWETVRESVLLLLRPSQRPMFPRVTRHSLTLFGRGGLLKVLMTYLGRPVVGCLSVFDSVGVGFFCEWVPLAGPSRANSSACFAQSLYRSSVGHARQSFKRWLRPLCMCGRHNQKGSSSFWVSVSAPAGLLSQPRPLRPPFLLRPLQPFWILPPYRLVS